MDRRVFLALGVLAAAAGSPAFAEQVRVAGEKGKMLHVNRAALIQAIYRVGLSRNGTSVGTKALTVLGHNRNEAARMAALGVSIVRKSGSPDKFAMLVNGGAAAGVALTGPEMGLLRRVASRPGSTIWDGRTWEGSASLHTKWDGHTWEGSEM